MFKPVVCGMWYVVCGMWCILVQVNYIELQVVQGRQNPAGYIGMVERSSLITEEAYLCGEY